MNQPDGGPGGQDSGADDGGSKDSGGNPDGGGGACTIAALGDSCSNNCPNRLRCEGNAPKGFCAPSRAHCGGFAGAKCEDETHHCIGLTGTDYGVCLTDEEKACVCAKAGQSVNPQDCAKRR